MLLVFLSPWKDQRSQTRVVEALVGLKEVDVTGHAGEGATLGGTRVYECVEKN